MLNGLILLPWWGYIVLTLILTHITIVSVTLYLHRCQAHCALDLHPALTHFLRFWLWLTTGMVTKEWVAVHRKHHAKTETKEDPHSPHTKGISTVFWKGAFLYRDESNNQETLKHYGHGTPYDWLERNIYSQFSYYGLIFLLILNLILFGIIGIGIYFSKTKN